MDSGDSIINIHAELVSVLKKKLDKIELYQDSVNSLVARVEATITASQAALYERVSEISETLRAMNHLEDELSVSKAGIVKLEKIIAINLIETNVEMAKLKERIEKGILSEALLSLYVKMAVASIIASCASVIMVAVHVLT